MSRRYEITDADIGGNVIKIDVIVQDDGGLQVFDWSMGPAADQFYGEGRDVESWIDITADATRELSVKLLRDWVEQPADDVAKHLAERYAGDTRASSKIKDLLDELDVPYREHMWA